MDKGSRLLHEGHVKRKRLDLQLTERQHVIIGFVLVILVAVSMLYCLGLASVALRQAWEQSPLQLNDNGSYFFEEMLDLTPEPTFVPTGTVTAPF
jgi:hypothetical protein